MTPDTTVRERRRLCSVLKEVNKTNLCENM